MDNRVNIAVILGVVFVLAFDVTLTQSENQVESQLVEDEIPEELIYEWLKKYDPSQNTISVSGSATASSNPDTLIIVLGVESEAKTANESLSQNSNSLNSVISSLVSSEISKDDIKTSNFSIVSDQFSTKKHIDVIALPKNIGQVKKVEAQEEEG